jgi:hypothetical protein
MKLKGFQKMRFMSESRLSQNKNDIQNRRLTAVLKAFPGFSLLRKCRRRRRLRLCFQLDFRRLRWGH